MTRCIWVGLTVFLLLFSTGCGTVASIFHPQIETEFGVYSGLRADWELWNRGYQSDQAILSGYEWMFDMPLSAVADTVLLPVALMKLLITGRERTR